MRKEKWKEVKQLREQVKYTSLAYDSVVGREKKLGSFFLFLKVGYLKF